MSQQIKQMVHDLNMAHQMVQNLEADWACAGENMSENACRLRTAHRAARFTLEMRNSRTQGLELGVAVLIGAGIQRLLV